MSEIKNPAARASANRVVKVKASDGIDTCNPTESRVETQSEIRAARYIARRFGISFHHARTVCELAGIGGLV